MKRVIYIHNDKEQTQLVGGKLEDMLGVYEPRQAISPILNSSIPSSNSELINNEMAIMNKKDAGMSPLPFGAFSVIIHSDGHNPSHIHVISKQEGFELKYSIADGHLMSVVKDGGKKSKPSNFSDTTKRVAKWLQLPSTFKPGDTNQTICQLFWNVYHS